MRRGLDTLFPYKGKSMFITRDTNILLRLGAPVLITALFDVSQIAIPVSGAVGVFAQFADH